MYNRFYIHRPWLLALACSVTLQMFSCNRKADIPKPTMEQVSDGMVSPQEIATLQQAFAASGYSSELKQVNQSRTSMHQWQPQWNASFKALDAVFVPLLLTDKTLTNFKHFLVIRNGVFSSALYITSDGQPVESVEDLPAFLRTFTGKMALRRLGTKKTFIYMHDKGQARASDGNAAKSGKSTAAKTQGCITTTTCYWEYTCPNDYRYLSVSVGTDGCKEDPGPVSSVICGTPNPTGSWALWWSDSSTECSDDIPPNDTSGPSQTFQAGWYKIKVVSSGLVLDVRGGSLADGAQVVQWYDQGSDNQIWYVNYAGNVNQTQVYSFTPRSNYLYWQALNAPFAVCVDQKLGMMTNSNNAVVPTNVAGALAQIWTMSTSTAPGDIWATPSPFAWFLTYQGTYNPNNLPYGGGFSKYTLTNRYSGLYLDVQGGGPSADDNLGQWPANNQGFGSPNQQFLITQVYP